MPNEINPQNLIQEALKKYPDLADETTNYVMYCVQVVENIKKEIKSCDNDYGRYEIPVDWNNIDITDQVGRILEIAIGVKKPDYLFEKKDGMYDSLLEAPNVNS